MIRGARHSEMRFGDIADEFAVIRLSVVLLPPLGYVMLPHYSFCWRKARIDFDERQFSQGTALA